MTVSCPHGDPACPCPDGDACHYEGPDAWACPNPPPGLVFGWVAPLSENGEPGDPLPIIALRSHCHVEGCDSVVSGGCGLLCLSLDRMIGDAVDLAGLRGRPGWACGATRAIFSDAVEKMFNVEPPEGHA